MKKMLLVLITLTAIMTVSCKKDESKSSKSYSVEYHFEKVGSGTFTVYYSLKGTTYTVNNASDGWSTTLTGATGDYASISCTPPYDATGTTGALVQIKYNGQALGSDYQNWPSTSSASGTLP